MIPLGRISNTRLNKEILSLGEFGEFKEWIFNGRLKLIMIGMNIDLLKINKTGKQKQKLEK